MAEPEVFTRPTAYDVSVWPDSIECIDSQAWKLTVEYRGRDLWAICRGARSCLSRSGSWDWESIPSEREEAWLYEHRYTLDEALVFAAEYAPGVMVNGMTATEVLARHRRRHPDGNCHG